MAIIVQKYGGTSVANVERVMNVARRIIKTKMAGNSVVVVVSAQGDTTDRLIESALEINPKPLKREMDALLSTGEQMSSALLAMAIHSLGHDSISLTGPQVGIKTSSIYSNARIESICTDRMKSELDNGNIVIVAGFQGLDEMDNVTTLGRGGSDTTAVALATALEADFCEIYTDVDGVYTADPRVVKNATKLKKVSFDEMLELATQGARVLANRAVEMGMKYNTKIIVRSSLNENEGTLIEKGDNMEKMVVRGIAHDSNAARISVLGVEDTPGHASAIFGMLAEKNINIDIILQSTGPDGTKDISFTIADKDIPTTIKLIEDNKDKFGCSGVSYSDDVAKVSVVGAGMTNNPGVASIMFKALADANINIEMISTSEIKISCVINRADVDKAVKAVHAAYELDKIQG